MKRVTSLRDLPHGYAEMPRHTEHYSDAPWAVGNKVVKVQPSNESGKYHLFFQDSAHEYGYQDERLNVSPLQALHLLHTFFCSPEPTVGMCFRAWINQAWRDCEIVCTTKTRARIAYEMPNAGECGAWRGTEMIAGRRYLVP